MAYVLGIDLGTSYSAAAVGHADGRVEMFQLGQRTAAIPSLVLVRADGEVLVGEAAERRSLTEPARTAREFKRRLGDPVPLILGGTPYGPEALLAILLRSIVEQVTRQLGVPPAHVVVTHPASYGPYKLDLLQQAARQSDLSSVSFVSEPVAAAVHYASLEQVPVGARIAVYDFGGGTFDATMLEKTEAGFDALGTPEGLERLGGVDFDEAIFRHVVHVVGAPLTGADAADPMVQAGLARLREKCRRAKEALSADSDATIPVSLPGLQTEVRITRGEFEAMIEPRIAETVAAVNRAARSAGLQVAELDRILLVGGTSRIPRIAERVRAATGRPVAVDVHPKHGVALGAARVGLPQLAAAGTAPDTGPGTWALTTPGTAQAATSPRRSVEPAPAPDPTPAPDRSPLAREAPRTAPTSRSEPRSTRPDPGGRPSWLFPAVVAAVVGVATLGVLLASGLLTGGAPAASAASTAPTRAPAPTLPPAASALPTPAPGAKAELTGVTLTGGRYQVGFTTTGFTPSMAGQHVHFFWDTVPPEQAGSPASGPYVVYAGPSPFTEFGTSGRPAAAEAICVIVANADHTVIPGSGSCAPLP